MDFKAGDNFSFVEFVSSPTGALAAADALPTAYAVHNGVRDNSLAVNVAALSTGTYALTGTIPSGYAAGDVVQIVINATIGGIATGSVAGEFTVGKVAASVAGITTETGETLLQTLRILRAVLAGNSTVAGNVVTFTRADGVTGAISVTLNTLTGARSGATPGTV